MWRKEEYIWYLSLYIFFLFGTFVYTMGLIWAVSHNSSGLYWMISGIVILLIVVVVTFIFHKKPYITTITSIGCFYFVVSNLTKYSFLDNMEKAHQETSPLGGSESLTVGIPTLRLLHTIITIIFFSIGIIDTIFSVYIYKRYSKEWKGKIKDYKFKVEELNIREEKPSITVDIMKFKYCPKCLYQVKIESGEDKCPKCDLELKLPGLISS